MKNNAIISSKDVVSFKDDIAITIDHFCVGMSPEDKYALLDILKRKIDRFCLSCLMFEIDFEEAVFNHRKETKNNVQ